MKRQEGLYWFPPASESSQPIASGGKGEGDAFSGIISWGGTRGFGGPLRLLTWLKHPYFLVPFFWLMVYFHYSYAYAKTVNLTERICQEPAETNSGL